MLLDDRALLAKIKETIQRETALSRQQGRRPESRPSVCNRLIAAAGARAEARRLFAQAKANAAADPETCETLREQALIAEELATDLEEGRTAYIPGFHRQYYLLGLPSQNRLERVKK